MRTAITLLLTAALLTGSAPATAEERTSFEEAKKLYKDALFYYEMDAYKEALQVFLRSQKLNPRSSTILYIARCYKELNHPAHALYYFRKYMPTYRAEERQDPPPPEVRFEVEQQIRRFKREVARLKEKEAARKGNQAAARDSARRARAPTRAVRTAQAGEPTRGEGPLLGRKKLWLASGVAAGVLAVGFEIAAWISYAEADGLYTDDDAFANHTNMVIAGHVLAGIMAAASGVSFYLWNRSREPSQPNAALWIMPSKGGAALSGAIRF